MDRGLIDFPAEVDGQDALLCWHVGEERIAFWHSPDGRVRRPEAARVSAGAPPERRARRRGRGLPGAARGGDAGRGRSGARATPTWRRTPRPGRASWGRLLGALKMAILAGDGAEPIARQAARRDGGCRLAGVGVRAGAGAGGARRRAGRRRDARRGRRVRARRPCAGGARRRRPAGLRGCARRDRGRLRGPRPAPLRRRRSPTPRSSWSGWPSRAGSPCARPAPLVPAVERVRRIYCRPDLGL